jgi:hypothetical protein
LQGAYDGGNTIATNGDDIAITLNGSDKFSVTTAGGGTGYSQFILSDGSNGGPAGQLVLVENQDTNQAIASGIKIQSAAGGITNALDLSDPEIVNALSLGQNDITATNFSLNGGTGDVTTAGDVTVNGGDVATTQTTFNLFNSTVTTLNVAGAATTVNLGATTGVTTINNATVTLANATAFNALSALTKIDSLEVGGGYASTGVTISNAGNITAAGTLTVDGTSLFTGDVTATSDLAVNGGDITTTAGTASLFNSGATTLNIGGAATAISLGSTTGTTTINNNFVASRLSTFNGDVLVGYDHSFDASGSATFTPNDSRDITFNTDTDSTLVLNGLQTASGTALCLDGTNSVVQCSSASTSLQSSYNGGNIIATTDNRDIIFNLSNTATDSNFRVQTAAGSTGFTHFFLADGDNATPAGQLVLIENQDTNNVLGAGIKVQSAAGGITNALDLSDPEIVNALSLGANDITATNFAITGSNGNITTAGDLALNGGDLTTTNGSATIFNANATDISIGDGAATISLGNIDNRFRYSF